MGTNYLKCETCGKFCTANFVPGTLLGRALMCCNCGKKVNLSSLESRTCEKCKSTFYAPKGSFADTFVCPNGCDNGVKEVKSKPEKEPKPFSTAPVAASPKVPLDVDVELIPGVYCPDCSGELVYYNGYPYCTNCRKYIERADIADPLIEDYLRNHTGRKPRVIEWPVEKMGNKLLFLHGGGSHIPMHSLIVVHDNQLMIYRSAYGTQFKSGAKSYTFFPSKGIETERLDALYTDAPEEVNLLNLATSVLFMSLHNHQRENGIINIEIPDTKYIADVDVRYAFSIVDPRLLTENAFSFNEEDETYLGKLVESWCWDEIKLEVRRRINRLLNDMVLDNCTSAAMEAYLEENLTASRANISTLVDGNTREFYGLKTMVRNFSVKVRRKPEYCPTCHEELELSRDETTAQCKNGHIFSLCKKCGKYSVYNQKCMNPGCGAEYCVMCGSLLEINFAAGEATCTGPKHHKFKQCGIDKCGRYAKHVKDANKCMACGRLTYD